MPEYLLTGRGPDGRKSTENVEAASADEAVRRLRERGFDDVVLHTDDLGARFTHQRALAEHISPRDYLLIRNLPLGLGFLAVVTLQGYRRLWFVMACAALALAELRFLGHPWGAWDTACVAVLLFPPAFALLVRLALPDMAKRHRRMVTALHWGRWDDALRLADRLSPKTPPDEVALRKAQALAGMGRLEEGLKLVEPFGDGRAVPEWVYRNMLAQLYQFGRRQDEAIAHLTAASELAPDNASLLLALADRHAWNRRDPRKAREFLDRARGHALSDVLAPNAGFVEGVILLEEGRPQEARPLLETALREFSRRRHLTLMELLIEKAQIALAVTLASLGEHDEALRLYRKARPRLVALGSENLERFDRAVGWPGGG